MARRTDRTQEEVYQRRLTGSKAYNRALTVMKQRHLPEYREAYYEARKAGKPIDQAEYAAKMKVAQRFVKEWDEVLAEKRKELGLE